MYRLIFIIALSLSFTVTACGGGGKKRVSLAKGKTKPGTNNPKASDKTNKLNALIADSKCLRIDKLIAGLVAMENEPILIYTSDVNIGNLTAVGGNTLQLMGETNLKVRAVGTLTKDGFDPVLESTTTQRLQSSSIESLVRAVTMSDKCDIVAIQGIAETPNFDVIKGPRPTEELLLRNQKNPSILLHFQYNRVDKLTVTRYLPTTENYCGKNHSVRMTKYVIAREKAMERVELERGYAEVIAASIKQAPADLAQAVTPGSNTSVALSVASMLQVKESLRASTFTAPVCP